LGVLLKRKELLWCDCDNYLFSDEDACAPRDLFDAKPERCLVKTGDSHGEVPGVSLNRKDCLAATADD